MDKVLQRDMKYVFTNGVNAMKAAGATELAIDAWVDGFVLAAKTAGVSLPKIPSLSVDLEADAGDIYAAGGFTDAKHVRVVDVKEHIIPLGSFRDPIDVNNDVLSNSKLHEQNAASVKQIHDMCSQILDRQKLDEGMLDEVMAGINRISKLCESARKHLEVPNETSTTPWDEDVAMVSYFNNMPSEVLEEWMRRYYGSGATVKSIKLQAYNKGTTVGAILMEKLKYRYATLESLMKGE
ncbi:hypothetical protein D3C75_135670 [compost metagenome]